ncbi:predicted protein [Plenodomus lingam JN3]|uniref:Predicted protein n=1 Tax=Leptosphaeria maculans (strain JN3 / isolate v23.1.3 / race Av1-4-5-6-7-8) TaxID=985895 RepID=E4ZT09_LEPMJ|nr:predicted protein [Plenodomus lingam JN3]CBX94597.1 predicted protein [Plenodomus lingam JN3]
MSRGGADHVHGIRGSSPAKIPGTQRGADGNMTSRHIADDFGISPFQKHLLLDHGHQYVLDAS